MLCSVSLTVHEPFQCRLQWYPLEQGSRAHDEDKETKLPNDTLEGNLWKRQNES